MSLGVIIATHGLASQELLKSSELIAGKQENAVAITFEEGESLSVLESKFKDAFDKLSNNTAILILVDMIGGSPFNVAATFDCDIVAGVNIPMLLETFMTRETVQLGQLIEQVVSTGKESINKITKIQPTEDEEEF